MNKMRQNNGAAELLEKIRALDFVKVELELFLDTHPSSKVALEYYRETVDALEELVEEYHASYGPLVAAGSMSPDHWSWIDTPWPWQRDSDVEGMKEV